MYDCHKQHGTCKHQYLKSQPYKSTFSMSIRALNFSSAGLLSTVGVDGGVGLPAHSAGEFKAEEMPQMNRQAMLEVCTHIGIRISAS